MAEFDKKVSELADGAPAVATDQVPIARAGATLRLTLANLQGLASVTSAEVVAAVAAEISNRTSADAVLAAAVNVVSNAVSAAEAALSVKVNTVSNALSAAGVDLSTKINTVSNAVSALVVAHDTLSNRVSANSGTGGAASVTSAELVTAANAVSAQALTDINVVSNAVSVLTENLNKVKKLADAFTVSTAALGDISGMIMTVSVGGLYEMNAAMFVRYTSTAAAAVGFGLTFPGMVQAGGVIEGMVSIVASNLWNTSTLAVRAWFNEEASGSIVLSIIPGISASATRNLPVFYRATFLVSTGGTINLQARSSSALTTSAPVIVPGSYMRIVKIA